MQSSFILALYSYCMSSNDNCCILSNKHFWHLLGNCWRNMLYWLSLMSYEREMQLFYGTGTDILILSVHTHTHMHVSWLSLFGFLIFQNILVRERVRMRERQRGIVVGSLWTFWCGRQACPVCSLFNSGSKERWALCVQINIVWEQAVCWGTLHNLTPPNFLRQREIWALFPG